MCCFAGEGWQLETSIWLAMGLLLSPRRFADAPVEILSVDAS